ncbi:hypothetical protein C4579_03130 [Candidatus Microgenomates bacterium]|nr:MAG: hypothetical protein C4579_03130 [Candidatus Microgenomates bacterium]
MKNILTLLKNNRKPAIVFLAILFIAFVWINVFEVRVLPSNRFLSLVGKAPAEPQATPTAETLRTIVVPQEGYTVDIAWGDLGKQLVASGAIDLEKFRQNYQDPKYQELLTYLTETKNESIKVDQDSAYFWVNVLWALGLTQKSAVLEKGVMGTEYKDQLGNFASTGGWTLGSKDAVSLYSSQSMIPLTADQQTLVVKISSGIYRPCCGNPTSFPDCNHGMAILGLVELMVSQGFSEDEIYQAALAFNTYWFPTTYVDLAYYFQTQENTAWDEVSAQKVLSAQFSSAQGYQEIKQKIGTIPGAQSVGASCGA